MNPLDKLMVEQITTRPWHELSLLGVEVDGDQWSMRLTLTWVERGEEQEGWSEVIGTNAGADLFPFLEEARVFARGAIPVAWNAPAQQKAILELLTIADATLEIDRTLCFLFRPSSRWLDPSVWCRARTGKHHPIETIAKSIDYKAKSRLVSIDPAELAHQLAHREGFPVRLDWTASELAHWQEDARAAHLRTDDHPTS